MRYCLMLLLIAPAWTFAQRSDTIARSQKSYGINFMTAFSAPGESVGAMSFEAEHRKNPRYSWIWTAGREWEDTDESWGELPVTLPVNGQDSPSRSELRRFDDVRQSSRRSFLGGGPQVNYRIGSGDLGASALPNLGYGELWQRVGYRAFTYSGNSDRMEFPLAERQEVARISYYDIIQPGLRLQLHYTLWITPRFAVRSGAYLSGYGGIALHRYDKSGEQPRYRVDGIHREIFNWKRGPFGDGLPDKSLFQSPSPHAIRFQSGISISIVYKPQLAL